MVPDRPGVRGSGHQAGRLPSDAETANGVAPGTRRADQCGTSRRPARAVARSAVSQPGCSAPHGRLARGYAGRGVLRAGIDAGWRPNPATPARQAVRDAPRIAPARVSEGSLSAEPAMIPVDRLRRRCAGAFALRGLVSRCALNGRHARAEARVGACQSRGAEGDRGFPDGRPSLRPTGLGLFFQSRRLAAGGGDS
jgi:hypothetical protein